MLVARPIAQLDQAQAITAGDQTHRFGIDGNRDIGREQVGGGQVFFVKMDRHEVSDTVAQFWSKPHEWLVTTGGLLPL